MGWSNITRCDSKFFGDRISGKKRNAVKSSHHQKQKVFARTCFCCTSFVVDAWYRIGERFHTHKTLFIQQEKNIWMRDELSAIKCRTRSRSSEQKLKKMVSAKSSHSSCRPDMSKVFVTFKYISYQYSCWGRNGLISGRPSLYYVN